MFTNYVHQLTMQSKKYISTHFSRVANPLSDQPNNVLISKNINVHASFEVLLALNMNTGVFVACLIDSFNLSSSRLLE